MPIHLVGVASREVSRRVHEVFPDADVVVHTQPLALDNETIADRVRMISSHHGHAAHRIAVQRVDGRLVVTMDLEVHAQQSIREAHDAATALEAAIRNELGPDVDIDTRIQPLLSETLEEAVDEPAAGIMDIIDAERRATPHLVDVHNVRVRRSATGRHVSMHCRFDDHARLERVEQSIRSLEHRLFTRIPDAERIVLHAEPVLHQD